jgi:2-amino-4-hydroxy-6-hydroxymethyldihydropteridine diphosphokinase
MEHTAYIAVGSNMGDREEMIAWARAFLLIEPAIRFIKSSAVISTVPLGGPPQDDYLNAVWLITTAFSPQALIEYLLHVEKLLGRKRRVRNGPRTIDLDILFYDNKVISRGAVVLPHPRLHEREFIVRLLNELSPGLRHPVLERTVAQLLEGFRHESDQIKA